MDTARLNRPWLDQPDWEPQQPDPHKLDASKLAFVFDADMDELTILYYGKERRHAVHPISPIRSALIDPVTGEEVGVLYSQFLETIVRGDPRTAMILMFAAVLVGGQAREPMIDAAAVEAEHHAGFWKRLVRASAILRGTDDPNSILEQKRQSLAALLPTPC